MKSFFFTVLIFIMTSPLYPIEGDSFLGIWEVENIQAIQIIQLYTDGYDHFTNGYLIRNEYLDDPLTYSEFDFVDEDLLYVTRADGTRLRGFYQIKENSGINSDDFPSYIFLEDKYTNNYYFPVRIVGEEKYEINYKLELNLRNQLIQISCIAHLSRKPTQ